MIEINLVPEQYRKKEVRTVKLPPLALTRYMVALLVGLAIVAMATCALVAQKYFERQSLDKQKLAIAPQAREIESLKNDTAAIQKKLKTLRQMTDHPFYWARVLNVISNELTDGVWLTRIALEEKIIKKDEGKAKRVKKTKSGDKEKTKGAGVPGAVRQVTLVISGLADSKIGGTASVTSFSQNLDKNEEFKQAFSKVVIDKIGRAKDMKDQLFEFTISCSVKEKKAEAKAGSFKEPGRLEKNRA